MFIEERHEEILKIIKENGRISIGEIQEKFGVSVDSARRDLRILEEKKLLKRTHGGAIPLNQVGQQINRRWSADKMERIYENYDAIAKKAVAFIKPNDVVYITSASIGYLMLKYLPRDIEFTVVTNSIDNAAFLRDYDNIIVYVLGGRMKKNGRITDAFAQEFARGMQFDVSFITGSGFTASFGVSNGTPETSAFQKAIAENSRKNIALFPNEKIGHKAFLKDVDAKKFDVLITDWDAVEDELSKIEDIGIEVIVVEKE